MKTLEKLMQLCEQYEGQAAGIGIIVLILSIALIIGTCSTCSSVLNIDGECDCEEIQESIQKYCAPYERSEKDRKNIEEKKKTTDTRYNE